LRKRIKRSNARRLTLIKSGKILGKVTQFRLFKTDSAYVDIDYPAVAFGISNQIIMLIQRD
jgi:hypothetical protein